MAERTLGQTDTQTDLVFLLLKKDFYYSIDVSLYDCWCYIFVVLYNLSNYMKPNFDIAYFQIL